MNLSADDVLAADDPATAALAFDVAFSAESAPGVRYTIALAEQDDKHYARLEAKAVPAKPETGAEEAPTAAEPGEAPSDTAPAAEKADPEATATVFNQRHHGWTYTLPQHSYQRLAKNLDDVLAPTENQ